MTSDPEERDELRARGELAARLDRAFSSTPHPTPPVTWGTGPFNDEIERALAGKNPDQLSPADAYLLRGDLRFLTEEALLYYLPALLRLVLAGEPYIDGLDTFTFLVLAPPDNAVYLHDFEKQMSRLDPDQRAVIADYVAWYCDQDARAPGCDRALTYWRSDSG